MDLRYLDPYFLCFSQNMTTDCLLIYGVLPILPAFASCKPKIVLKLLSKSKQKQFCIHMPQIFVNQRKIFINSRTV